MPEQPPDMQHERQARTYSPGFEAKNHLALNEKHKYLWP